MNSKTRIFILLEPRVFKTWNSLILITKRGIQVDSKSINQTTKRGCMSFLEENVKYVLSEPTSIKMILTRSKDVELRI